MSPVGLRVNLTKSRRSFVKRSALLADVARLSGVQLMIYMMRRTILTLIGFTRVQELLEQKHTELFFLLQISLFQRPIGIRVNQIDD